MYAAVRSGDKEKSNKSFRRGKYIYLKHCLETMKTLTKKKCILRLSVEWKFSGSMTILKFNQPSVPH